MEEKKQLYIWNIHLRGSNFRVVAYTAEDAVKKARSLATGSKDLIALQCGEKVDAVSTKGAG